MGITDQMSEPTQRGLLVPLGKQVCSSELYSGNFFLKLLVVFGYFAMCCHMSCSNSCFLQLQSPDATPSMRVAALRTMSYALKTLGEVKDNILCFAYVYLLFVHFINSVDNLLGLVNSWDWDSMQLDFLSDWFIEDWKLVPLCPYHNFSLMGPFFSDK